MIHFHDHKQTMSKINHMLKENKLRYDKMHNHLLDQNEIKRSIHHDFSSMVLTKIIKNGFY